MNDTIGLDFETYGGVSLPTHGLDRYVSDPTFLPLIGALHYTDGRGASSSLGFDFVLGDRDEQYRKLHYQLSNCRIAAHNAGFERAVLHQMGLVFSADYFVDSAVVSRGAGGGAHLEAAAPQLLGTMKLDMGKNLIKLFSIPGKYQEVNGNLYFDPQIVADHAEEWRDFMYYCKVDAELSYRIVNEYRGWLPAKELDDFAPITLQMNDDGWPVDVEMVEEMQRRYLENQQVALTKFLQAHDPYVGTEKQLNLQSLKQLKEWCAERGVRVNSFDEKHVARLRERLEKKLDSMANEIGTVKYIKYQQVLELCITKQVLGGSSLKKLKTILDTVYEGRLKDQYIHIGAGQSWRTTGRSVQMQNLKRLDEVPAVMEDLLDPATEWSNEELAHNLRQVFTASDPNGALIVGDFSSVESRGLAWAAQAQWKTDAYRQGKDMYKVLATKIFPGLTYDAVTKPQRQTGKVGELSCGYGAGGGAVQAFADGMGVPLTEAEAATLVRDWRAANPEVENFWYLLHEALLAVVNSRQSSVINLPDGFRLLLEGIPPPASLEQQHKGAISIRMSVVHNGTLFMVRYFHGCYMRGSDVNYYKPADRKTGPLWSATFTNPKTKQVEFHKLYGGKLTGIFVQSFCRELFMLALHQVSKWVEHTSNVTLVGQFHDEIVLDWKPGGPGSLSLDEAKRTLETIMSNPGPASSFPMAADIKHDYRYTK